MMPSLYCQSWSYSVHFFFIKPLELSNKTQFSRSLKITIKRRLIYFILKGTSGHVFYPTVGLMTGSCDSGHFKVSTFSLERT